MFKRLHPEFRRFLFDRGLFISFHLNMLLQASSWQDYTTTRECLTKCTPLAFTIAFNSTKSLEGSEYWESVERKWEIYLRYLKSGGVITDADID